jgi:transcription elongation factor
VITTDERFLSYHFPPLIGFQHLIINVGDRDDSLMGKTVRIQAGQWKGYLGSVSHTTATHVQVELHSRLKKVMVVKERVHVIGDKYGATGENGVGGSGFGTGQMSFMGGATPMHGGATPMHGGATPMYGGATPMHSGATPMHGTTSATPSRDSYGYVFTLIQLNVCFDIVNNPRPMFALQKCNPIASWYDR